MSRREDRERKTAQWLEQLQAWKQSGKALSAYARSCGLAPWTMYHWRNALRREGLWCDDGQPPGASRHAANAVGAVPLRFSRVTLKEPLRSSSLTIRVQLHNGRRVEVELSDRDELADVLAVLEQPA